MGRNPAAAVEAGRFFKVCTQGLPPFFVYEKDNLAWDVFEAEPQWFVLSTPKERYLEASFNGTIDELPENPMPHIPLPKREDDLGT